MHGDSGKKMSPHKQRCRTCKEWFMPKSDINVFCSRRCFKKHYYHEKKGEEERAQKYPEFTCPKCGQHILLAFDPARETFKWLKYWCPGCNSLNIHVVDTVAAEDKPIT